MKADPIPEFAQAAKVAEAARVAGGARPAQGIGAPLPRLEDLRMLTGQGRYADDVNLPHQARGYVLRAPFAHARIRGIDVRGALDVPGVIAVLTGEDYEADALGHIPCVSIPPTITGGAYRKTPFPPLARERVLAIGDGVAFVVADTLAAAMDAAERIQVDYEALPAAPTVEAAIAPDAPLVWPDAPGNLCFHHDLGDPAATAAAFARADKVVKARIRSQRVAGNPLEPRVCIGAYFEAERRYHLTSSTANPHRIRLLLAEHILKVPAHCVHVVAGDVGGGFGTKGGIYPEEILVVWAARRIGRPVKWISDRSEAFLSDFNGRDQLADAELALTRDGDVLALRVAVHHNLGCQLGPSTAHPPLVGCRMLSGVYAFPAMHVSIDGIFTHSRTLTTYRGAGRPEATLVVERMLDIAAAELGIDPIDIRRRNLIRPGQMPYTTALKETYDCGEFEAMLDAGLALADWPGFAARRAATEARGRLRGRGLALYIEVCGTVSDRMEIRFDATGGLTILAGTFSYGQGHETSYAQMVHEWLGVPIERIRFVQGDTDKIANGRGTFGSRSMTIGGSALLGACNEVIAKGRRVAAILLGCDENALRFEAGVYRESVGEESREESGEPTNAKSGERIGEKRGEETGQSGGEKIAEAGGENSRGAGGGKGVESGGSKSSGKDGGNASENSGAKSGIKTSAAREITLDRVARATYAWGAPKPLPADLWSGLEGRGYFTAQPQNYPNGCYVAEVEVDPETGNVTLDRIAAVDDVGNVINPLVLEGQVHGGIAQGAGQALKEQIVHAPDGQLLTGAFTDYAMPKAGDFCRFTLGLRPVPTATNPLGVKGGAETATVGLPPAIIAAIVDALRPYGVRDLDMPATPLKVWEAIQRGRNVQSGGGVSADTVASAASASTTTGEAA